MTEPQYNDRLDHLLSALVDGAVSPSEADELTDRLRTDASARQAYIAWMTLDARLRVRHAAPVKIPELTLPDPHISHSTIHNPYSTFRISRLVLAAAVVLAIGILAYSFWPGTNEQTVVKQIPAAKIVHLADAKWAGASTQAGDTLNAGQQLLLHSGSAEITFNSQARVILEGPAELTIVDAAACRLAGGKLVARVPDPAKGFKVHTPDGTVTDLGTEFGVYVDARADQQASREEEQQPSGGPQFNGKQPAVTEVHVFRGQVEVARSEVGSGKSEAIAQNPTSDLRPSFPPAKPSRSAITKSSRFPPPTRSSSRSTSSRASRERCSSRMILSRIPSPRPTMRSRAPSVRGSFRRARARDKGCAWRTI
ncbi:MAG: FecR domain-containing protein [Planctomycetes bacterium]|nr:FecR domain-containing protein [Planctomycetota bacterium]